MIQPLFAPQLYKKYWKEKAPAHWVLPRAHGKCLRHKFSPQPTKAHMRTAGVSTWQEKNIFSFLTCLTLRRFLLHFCLRTHVHKRATFLSRTFIWAINTLKHPFLAKEQKQRRETNKQKNPKVSNFREIWHREGFHVVLHLAISSQLCIFETQNLEQTNWLCRWNHKVFLHHGKLHWVYTLRTMSKESNSRNILNFIKK